MTNPQQTLIEHLRDNFSIIDNLPINYSLGNSKIMNERASFLISSIIAKDKFDDLFDNSKYKKRNIWTFPLVEPIIITRAEDMHGNKIDEVKFSLNEFIINTEGLGSWYLKIESDFISHIENISRKRVSHTYGFQPAYLNNNSGKYSIIWVYGDFPIDIDGMVNEAKAKFNEQSLFDLLKPYLKKQTTSEVCFYLDDTVNLYDSVKSSYGALNHSNFRNQKAQEPPELAYQLDQCFGEVDVDIVYNLLTNCIDKNIRDLNLNAYFDKYHYDLVKFVFSFKDNKEDFKQKLIKQFDYKSRSKYFLPCTAWKRRDSDNLENYCLPFPGRQILYNLDLMNKKISTIVLSDSVEIADKNQQKNHENIVWTSWLCDEGQYGQVDWTPLKDAKEIYYLITNHSGQSLANAYIKANGVATYLKKELDLNLKFIQVQVEFNEPEIWKFGNVTDFVKVRQDNKPMVVDESVIVMDSFGEFEKMYRKAVQSIEKPEKEFWEEAPETLEVSNLNKTLPTGEKLNPIDYLMRPIIVKGEITMLYAQSGLGKSALSLSLCAAVISGKELFPEMWWATSLSDEEESEIKKVLYLDFESSREKINTRKKRFAEHYFKSKSREEKQQYFGNFIIKDLRNNPTDSDGKKIKYGDSTHHGKVMGFLDEAKEQGIKGQEVDLIVFDTLTKLTGAENIKTWENLQPLLNTIMERGIAILIVHHTAKDGDIRGFSHKDDDLSNKVKLSRPNSADGTSDTLGVPMTLEVEKLRDSSIQFDYEPFEIQFIDEKWQVYEPKQSKLERFSLLVDAYKKEKYYRDAIAKMLGLKLSTYSNRLKECKLSSKKSKKSKKSKISKS